MIDSVAMTSLMQSLGGATGAAATSPAAGTADVTATPGFQNVLMQVMSAGVGGSESGGMGGSEESSDPAAALLPLLIATALTQNPPIAPASGADNGAADQAAAPKPGVQLPALDPVTGGVIAPPSFNELTGGVVGPEELV